MSIVPSDGAGNTTAIQLKPEQEVSLKKWYDNALVAAEENYKNHVAVINKRNECFAREIKVIQAMATINTVINSKDADLDTKLLYRIEKYLNDINQETLHASNELHVYVKLFGIENSVELLCETINYFVSSSGAFSKITSIGIMRLATHIANNNPFFKMVELFMIFRDGIAGEFGANFNKIDNETFHNWVKVHNERMSKYWELEASRNKSETGANLYQKLVDPKLEKLENYRRELTQRMNIKDEVETKAKKK